MFGLVRKSKYDAVIKERDIANDYFNQCVNERVKLEQSIREMADEIREMDQMIYRMSQCTSWETMRPIFNNLQSKQQVRQVEESKRIGNIVRKELIGVYSKPR